MKCFYHEDKDSVATCQNCGKGLCKECASKHTPCMCDDCVTNAKAAEIEAKKKAKEDALIDTTSEFIGAIIKGVIAIIVVAIIYNGIGGESFDAFELMFFFFPFGWSLLTYLEQYLPTVFIFNWLVYLIILIIKVALALFLGIFCFAYQVIKFAVKMIQQSKSK